MSNKDPLSPSLALLCKLGSIIVHFEEMSSPGGHVVDKIVINSLLEDPEVKQWLEEMDKLALLTKKRT